MIALTALFIIIVFTLYNSIIILWQMSRAVMPFFIGDFWVTLLFFASMLHILCFHISAFLFLTRGFTTRRSDVHLFCVLPHVFPCKRETIYVYFIFLHILLENAFFLQWVPHKQAKTTYSSWNSAGPSIQKEWMKDFISMSKVFSLKKLIGDTVYTVKYTLA